MLKLGNKDKKFKFMFSKLEIYYQVLTYFFQNQTQ